MTEDQDPLGPAPATGAAGNTGTAPAERTPLRVVASALRNRWGALVVAVLLGAVTGALLRSAAAPSYTATAKLLVDQQHPVDALLGTSSPPGDPTRDLSTSVRLIVVEPVAEQVRHDLGLAGSTKDLLSRVTAKLDGNTNIIDITARDREPRRAAQIANQFALDYRRLRAQSAGASLADAAAAGRTRLRRLGPGAEATPVGRELASEIGRLEILSALETGGVQVVRHAAAPESRSGIGSTGAALTGGLVGGLLGVVLIVLLSLADRRLYSRDDVERALGRNVLASVPRGTADRGRQSADGYAPAVDTYATLARVAFANADTGSNVLLVTSPARGEGAPEVVLDLVGTIAAFGRWALAIDADLRAPRLTQLARARSEMGLAALLTGDLAPERLKGQVVDVTPPALVQIAGEPHAWLLPAGPARASSQALLGGPTMAAIIQAARMQVDWVVIAGGPLAEPGDALPLAPLAGAAVLVVRRGKTREQDALRALRSLELLEVTVIGIVLTDVRGRRGWGSWSRGARRPAHEGDALPSASAGDAELDAGPPVPSSDAAVPSSDGAVSSPDAADRSRG
jgi:Mrp family chromosome partitioning ATPase/capsular polysaccharide biosynthesis protein